MELMPGEIMDAINAHNSAIADQSDPPERLKLAGGTLDGFLNGKGGTQRKKAWGQLSRQLAAMFMLGDSGLTALRDIEPILQPETAEDRADRIRAYLNWKPLEESGEEILIRTIRLLIPPLHDKVDKKFNNGSASQPHPNDESRNNRWYFDSAFRSWTVPARNTEARSELRRLAYFAAGGQSRTKALICRVSGGAEFLQVETGGDTADPAMQSLTPSGALTIAALRAGAAAVFVCPAGTQAETTAQAFEKVATEELRSMGCPDAARRVRIVRIDSTKSDWMHECWRFVYHSLQFSPAPRGNTKQESIRQQLDQFREDPVNERLLMLSREPRFGPCAFPMELREIESFKRFLSEQVRPKLADLDEFLTD